MCLLLLFSSHPSHMRLFLSAQLREVFSNAWQPARAVRRGVRAALQLCDGVRDTVAHCFHRKLLTV